tara:strand:- start:263508 stop:264566 length:1059 start_codon:yes stop_codon:yes gene_type:complete
MKNSTTIASALLLTLLAGTTALAGPEHKQTQDNKSHATASESQKTLEDFVGKIEAPELFIGSKAPDLKIAKYVKGDSVTGFDEGQVYVVEFWATWCGPCIAAFPHLSTLQEEHGENVTFIGVNVSERDTDQTARIERIEKFVEDQGENMSYTVAVETNSDMGMTWLRPAEQNGIPAAFIVDGTGSIAWIGHPMTMDEVLNDVVNGDFDTKAASERAIDGLLVNAGLIKFSELIDDGENLNDARQIANILIDDHLESDPSGLNQIAWMLLNTESSDTEMTDFKIALKAANAACEATEWSNWMILDTYAQAAYKTGNQADAIKWQKKAIELIPEEYQKYAGELQATLANYELDS